MTAARHLVIIGPMGVGKTTTATAVAAALGRPLRDSDADIEDRTGRTGRDIAATDGVTVLHELEADVLLDALRTERPVVVAAAASVVDRADCRDALRAPFVVTLDVDAPTLVDRIRSGDHRRAVTREEIATLMKRREPALAAVADLRLDARRSPAELTAAVLDARS